MVLLRKHKAVKRGKKEIRKCSPKTKLGFSTRLYTNGILLSKDVGLTEKTPDGELLYLTKTQQIVRVR